MYIDIEIYTGYSKILVSNMYWILTLHILQVCTTYLQ